jgi:hypothetical protein
MKPTGPHEVVALIAGLLFVAGLAFAYSAGSTTSPAGRPWKPDQAPAA